LACRRIGNSILFLLLIAVFSSCQPPKVEKELNPKILFGAGSLFLKNSTTIALKGSLEYRDSQVAETASFELFMNGPDSALFFVTGLLGADILTAIIIEDSAAIKVRGWQGFTSFGKNDILTFDEMGIDKISPFIIGFVLFPQYFYEVFPDGFDIYADTIKFKNQEIYFLPQTGEKFALRALNPPLMATYLGRKDIEDGFYPSRILLADDSGKWQLSANINKLILNKPLPFINWRQL
jgi:hypothetical protein